MSLLSWLFQKKNKKNTVNLSQGAKDFIEGKKDELTSSDIDPEGDILLSNFESAITLKKAGKLSEAEKLLIKSCEPPSIYTGHYRELFRIWRQFNRDDIKEKNYQVVIERVLRMLCFDDEMIQEMRRYWSIQQDRKLSLDYFDGYRNLLVSDAKALKKASEALNQESNLTLAKKLILSFAEK